MAKMLVNLWSPAAREPFLRLFDTFLSTETERENLGGASWTPAVNVEETEAAYRIEAELPGLTNDDIHITLEDNVLRLSGERKLDTTVKKENFHRIERPYGSFSRSFSLPQQVDGDKVQAAFSNGVLTVLVPKAEQARSRRIEISN
jgi:HSP20 family protein